MALINLGNGLEDGKVVISLADILQPEAAQDTASERISSKKYY